MDFFDNVNKLLLNQDFSSLDNSPAHEAELQAMASTYARIENALVVLSDMSTNQSTIYYGALADALGVKRPDEGSENISSIWEDDIFAHVHPDDMPLKYGSELRFFDFIGEQPKEQRSHFCLWCEMRMSDAAGQWITIIHRMFYLDFDSNNCPHKALCIYTPSTSGFTGVAKIINTVSGEEVQIGNFQKTDMLSEREIEVLKLIGEGHLSKEIASILCISPNTVNRHRQNILAKMHADNSMEAFRKAINVGLIRV